VSLSKFRRIFLGGVDLQFGLAMAAGGGSGVRGEAEAVEDGAKGQDRHEEDCQVKVVEVGCCGRVAVGVGDEA